MRIEIMPSGQQGAEVETRPIQRKKNVVEVPNESGIFTIIYGRHITPQNPEDLPTRIDGLFLEYAQDYTNSPMKALQQVAGADPRNILIQYYKLFRRLQEERIPVFLHDVAFKDLKAVGEDDKRVFLAETAVGLGAGLFSSFGLKSSSRRRAMLRVAGIVGGAYLLTPSIATNAGIATIDQELSKESAFERFADDSHPEWNLYTIKLRNAILAHKTEWLARQLGTHPHFATVIGRGHGGIEGRFQQTPEQRMSYLKTTKMFWYDKVVLDTIYKMARFDFDGRAWRLGQMIEIPELKDLVGS